MREEWRSNCECLLRTPAQRVPLPGPGGAAGHRHLDHLPQQHQSAKQLRRDVGQLPGGWTVRQPVAEQSLCRQDRGDGVLHPGLSEMTRRKIVWQGLDILFGLIWLAAAIGCIWAWATHP